jgi:hypothetical protein
MGSGAIIYIPVFIEAGLAIHNGKKINAQTAR